MLVPTWIPGRRREVAAACRYRGGKRGLQLPAAGHGGRSVWQHVDAADAEATVIAMIEDPEALDEIEAIAAVDGVHGFFIGRGDLTVAPGAPAMTCPRSSMRSRASPQRLRPPESRYA